MENSKNSIEFTRKRIMGLIGLVVFCMAFIFACLSKVLPIGGLIVGTFGIMTFPISIIGAFLCLAMFLGMSYTRSPKATRYFLFATFGLLFVIHSISTFSSLETVVRWNQFGEYLRLSYQKTTLLGSFGSIFCGLISMLLGAMGTIVVFVILTTIFGGLFIDYQIYGKFEAPHVKNIKNRKVKQRVLASDRGVDENGKLDYSFSKNDAVDEFVVDAKTYESELNSTTEYTQNFYENREVVDEITDQTITSDDSSYSGYYTESDDGLESQTANTFSGSNIYSDSNTYPNVYTPEMDDYRRQFMHATFGGNSSFDGSVSESTPVDDVAQSAENETFNFGNLNLQNSGYESNGSNEIASNTNSSELTFENEKSSIDDEISKILNTSEEEDDDVYSSAVPENTRFNFEPEKPIEQKPFEPPTNINFSNPAEQNFEGRDQFGYSGSRNDFENRNRGFSDSGFASGLNQNYSNFGAQNIPNSNLRQDNPNVQMGPRIAEPVQKPSVTVRAKEQKPVQAFNVGMAGVRYNPPPLSLLKTPKPDTGDYSEEQSRKSTKLENVLSAFKVNAKVKNIVRGPKITRFELAVPYGTSVKKIPSYENDVAAALSAKTILIKAPIPGSPYVGIELENDTFTTVYERELLESPAFQNCKDPLPIAIGKDISGEIVVRSLAKMVHLLIAGSTGSGKSVFIHNIVLSLIFKYGPDDLRLIMIDPKKVEFNRYNGLPHLLTPEVVMGSEKAINALKWAVKEMERRYDLMNKAGYNNIEPYNKSELVKAGQFEHMPYIVIIVDELAEIMLANKKESEYCIQRITQLARACGMHLILATQRPSVDIISGVIKNNIPSRIAFSLQSGIDSKTILNEVGAEKLLGQGDMIFAPTGTSSKSRLQAAYASDDEIKAVIDYDIKNNPANFDEAVENMMNADPDVSDGATAGFNGGDGLPSKDSVDGYFKTAVKLVMQNNSASISYLQRRLSIGYSRAARIVDQMEDKGYIAPANGSKVRKVLITPDQFYNEFGESFDTLD